MTEVLLSGRRSADRLSWSQASLLALQPHPENDQQAQICIFEPSSLQEHAVVNVPLDASKRERLVALQWSPGTQACQLLTATSLGHVYLWGQGAADTHQESPAAVDQWSSQAAFQFDVSEPVLVTWLAPATPWSWPPATAEPGGHQSLEAMFASSAACPQAFHWVRPGSLCCLAISTTAELQVAWKGHRMSGKKGSGWRKGQPLNLPLQAPLSLAAAIPDMDRGLRIAAVQESTPETIEVLQLTGDLTCITPAGSALSSVEVTKVASICCTPVKRLHWVEMLPQHYGTGLLAAGTSQEPPTLHVAAWHEQAPSQPGPAVTWQRSTDMLTRLLAADPDLHRNNNSPPNVVVDPAQGNGSPSDGRGGQARNEPRVSLSLDGSTCAVAWEGPGNATGPARVSHACLLATNSMQVISETDDPKPVQAIALSPAGLSLAAVYEAADTGALKLGLAHHHRAAARALKGASDPDQLAELLGLRLAWAMLTGCGAWDIVQCLRKLAEEEGLQWLRVALAQCDAILHAHPYSTRAFYGSRLNRLKLCVLQGATDPQLQPIVHDLWVRCYVEMLEGYLKCIMPTEEVMRAMGNSKQGFQLGMHVADFAALQPWMAWADNFTVYFLHTLQLWLMLREEARKEGRDASAADAMPCIRLLPDMYFAKRLVQVLLFNMAMAKVQGQRDKQAAGAAQPEGGETLASSHSDWEARASSLLVLLKRLSGLQRAIQESTAGKEEINKDVPGAEIALGEGAQNAFKGDWKLHYYRTYGAIQVEGVAKLFQDVKRDMPLLPAFKDSPSEPVTPAMLHKMAQKLGLRLSLPEQEPCQQQPMPPFAPPTPGLSTPSRPAAEPQLVDIGPALAELEVLPGLRMFPVRDKLDVISSRKRWRAQRDAAYGRLSPDDSRGSLRRDIVTGKELSWDIPASLVSLSGLTFFHAPDQRAMPGPDEGQFARVVQRAWQHACPLTGQLWRRVRQRIYE